MVSANGAQALAGRLGGGSCSGGFDEKGPIKSVVTPSVMAGFDDSESVVTSLAGFDSAGRRPQPPERRTDTPAAFR